jgi:hypothetical protein
MIPENIDKIPFFFIIGRPRSGTTLLQTLFGMHPNVVIPPESAVIKESYEGFKHIENWRKRDIKRFSAFLFRVRKFEGWNIDLKKIESTLIEHKGILNFPTIVRIVYSLYSSGQDKNIMVIGDKNPRYSKYPETMQKIIPGAKFIHVVRDHRDHILSMQRTGLLNGNLPLIAYFWKKSQIKMFKFIKNNPDDVISVRYEDFVEDPEKNLVEMCRFLGISFDPDLLKFYDNKDKIVEKDRLKSNQIFHQNLFNPVSSANVGKWRKNMKRRDILRADFIVGSVAEKSGYYREFKKRSVRGFFSVIPGYAYIYSYYILFNLIGFVPVRYRKKIKRRVRNIFPLGKNFPD